MSKNHVMRQLFFDGSIRHKLLNAEYIGFPFVLFFPGLSLFLREMSQCPENFFFSERSIASLFDLIDFSFESLQ
jgi:hypothetical protein